MTLPTGFATPSQAEATHPLHLVQRDGYADWHAAQPVAVQAWLDAQQFEGSAGTAMAWADGDARIAAAVLGIGDPLDPLSYAHAPFALPAGDWQAEAGDAANAAA